MTTTTRNLIGAGIIGAAAGILIWWLVQGQRPRDEGDRPPIIISDGSINVMLAGDPTNIGSWAGANANWVHDYTGRFTVDHFEFRIFNGKTNADEAGCSDPSVPLNTKEITIESANAKLTLSINAGSAVAAFDDAASLHKNTRFWLRRRGAPLQKVTFTKMGAGSPTICEFDMGGGPNAEPSVIHILQRKP